MRISILFYLVLIVLFSCKQDGEPTRSCLLNTCSVKNPVVDLNWLATEIENLKSVDSLVSRYFFISMAVYQGSTVFIFDNCCPLCDSIILLKNCQGELIGFVGEVTGTVNYQGHTITGVNRNSLKESQIIWKAANFACVE